MADPEVIVIGAGVIGLSVALAAQVVLNRRRVVKPAPVRS